MKGKNNFIKQNKGITLIALVVTIIVLLLLAGISISMLTGDNGILNRASQAKEETELSSLEEMANLVKTELSIDRFVDKDNLTQEKLLNAINNQLEGSVIQGNKVITSDSNYAIVVKNDNNLTIEVIKNQEGILADGELGISLEFNKDENRVYIYPKIGGIETYNQYAERILSTMTNEEKEQILTEATGATIDEAYDYIQENGFSSFDEFLIFLQIVPGYETENVELEIKLSDGSLEKISYPVQSYLIETVLSNGTFNYEINYGMQKVSKSIEVEVKEKVDQTQIFEYDTSTGYITGIKEEYLSLTPPQSNISQSSSTYGEVRICYLTYGYPYLTIPEQIDGTNIVGIDNSAFESIQNITILELPNSIVDIKSLAFFYCENLEKINIPNSVKSIGTSAFNGTSIRNVFIPKSVQNSGRFAFVSYNNLKIECEAETQPTGWQNEWCSNSYNNITVTWGVKK